MKRNVLHLIICFLLVLLLPACGSKQQSDGPKGMVLLSVGGVDEALFLRVKNFVTEHYMCDVRGMSIEKGAKEVPDSKELKKLMGKNDVCMLALVAASEKALYRESVLKDVNIALLNVTDLKKVRQPSSMKEDERYARRVEKESMRLLGKLLGVDDCPMPHCALRVSVSESVLDSKGRNFCPPCQEKTHNILVEKGLKLNP